MTKRIPQTAGNSRLEPQKIPKAISQDYLQMRPCWRIGHFDYQSQWGLNNLGEFEFVYSEKMLEIVTELNDDELNDILDTFDGKRLSVSEFWDKFEGRYKKHIPIALVNHINQTFIRNAFVEKIYPKLINYENNTWNEINSYSHRKGEGTASNNHFVSIQNIAKEAQKRLEKLGYSDRSEIYSLRLEGKIRIYGFIEMNCLDIIWVDLEHQIYECRKE